MSSSQHGFSVSPQKRYKLDSLRYWEVKMMPTEQKEVAGHMMPTIRGSIAKFGFKGKRRRITIETYTPHTPEESARIRQSSVMNLRSFNKMMAGRSSRVGLQADQLGEEDMVIFRMFKAKPTSSMNISRLSKTSGDDASKWDTESLENLSLDAPPDEDEDGEFRWQEKYRIRLFYVNILSSGLKSCRLKVGVGSDTKVKTISFHSEADLKSFMDCCASVKSLQKERADRLAAEFKEKNPNYSLKSQESMNDDDTETDGNSDLLLTKPLNMVRDGLKDGLKGGYKEVKQGYKEVKKGYKEVKKGYKEVKEGLERMLEESDEEDSDDSESAIFQRNSASKTIKNLGAAAMDSIRHPTVALQSVQKTTVKTMKTTVRTAAKIKNVMRGQSSMKLFDEHGEENTIDLLIEIVSACNLPGADKRSRKSDPYVRILDGSKVLHKTRHLSKNLNPVWTLSHNCFFLYRPGVDEFFETQELTFEVRDWDAIGKDTTLGTVVVNKQDIMTEDGERKEFKIMLTSEFTAPNDEPVLLALRFRQATEEDIDFMRGYAMRRRKKSRKAVFAGETVVPPKIHKEVNVLQQLKKEKHGTMKYLIKPGPDPNPNREDKTKWMNYFEIESEVVEPSREWIEAGSGTLGKLYVEVLHCDDLPNLDFSITGRDKTDPFVCLVFEDAIGHTDVLNDLLSPRWMPWTQRAFVFNIAHPNSQLFVGVFDYDSTDPNHDVVGRATANITNFHPNTIYTVKYKLHSIMNFVKVERGTITLRCRVEWKDERKTLLNGYSLSREPEFISVSKKSEFRTVSFTLTEEPSPYKLSLNSMSSYINELWTYWDFSYITEYFMCVFLWKSHFKIRMPFPVINYVTVKLPLRSMVAFAWGIALTRNFELFPSFLAYSVASVLFATLDGQANRPSPWDRPRGIVDFLGVLLFNKASRYPRVTESDFQEEIQEFEALEKAIDKNYEEVLNAYYEESDNFYKEAAETSFGAADVNMATQTKGMSDILMKPFVPTLLPVQLWLHWFCRIGRLTKGILYWRDSYTAFWIVAASMTASFVFAFLPWSFILKTLLKIWVWVFMGPWMKLVDIFYFRYKSRYHKTAAQIEDDLEGELEELSNQWSGFSKDRKTLFEKAAKDKDMKTYMFGGFVMPVPTLKEEFEYDNPIFGSSAEPADSEFGKRLCEVNIVSRKYGQQLFGNMIPLREKDMLRKQAEAEAAQSQTGSIRNVLDNSVKSLGASMRSLGVISEGNSAAADDDYEGDDENTGMV